ncbi:hypothetical protein P691DRAFT_724394 [Macrolepiota fuliginosa MF-IS2]|uniref:Uncharacterized protein n=1 Tax=Macrolepiota fuliginosa MF-IS2 TaxID=1400762 RepID=A0A9P5XIY9_9AGAR|nr:hypothetical protein P691DRAFT_724394 [Macrolepiota fuliginosa MF-IS2]
MRSLADHIDILDRNTKNIKDLAGNIAPSALAAGPFTNAILHSHLGDLIRDVDPSELGLFSLVQPERASAQEQPLELERLNFHGATPLRRTNIRHDDASRGRDADPELYAKAAMKYMDRYQLVRPMPRAQAQVQAILERIPILKQSIENLTDSLYQLDEAKTSTEPNYKTQLEEEERHIRNLRDKLSELTNKRTSLAKVKKSHLDLGENKSITHRPLASSRPNTDEDEFWNTPAASTRTLKFSGESLLMDEHVDFGDISTISFSASPAISKTAPNIFTDAVVDLPVEDTERRLFRASDLVSDEITSPKLPLKGLSKPVPATTADNSNDHSLDPKLAADAISSASQVPVSNRSKSGGVEDTLGITITREIEIIVTKIWTLMSDLVIVAAATKAIQLHDKPSTRDMIKYLESMQEVTPPDQLSATNDDGPSLQQVLTATLLVGLLASPTNHSLPLSNVKELLATRTDGAANPSHSNSSRIVYGCVAKRLLKIDRTGGEQIVRFDV